MKITNNGILQVIKALFLYPFNLIKNNPKTIRAVAVIGGVISVLVFAQMGSKEIAFFALLLLAFLAFKL